MRDGWNYEGIGGKAVPPALARRTHQNGRGLCRPIESVAKMSNAFKPGDEVFGTGMAHSQVRSVGENGAMGSLKSLPYSMEQAAAVPIAALTRLQALPTWKIQSGQKVLDSTAPRRRRTVAVHSPKS